MIRPPWLTTEPYVVIDLGTLGGESMGMAINAAGIVTGVAYLSSTDPHGGGVRAFRYADSVGMIDVGTLPQSNMSLGYGINKNLQIVGLSFLAGLEPHAFLAQEGFPIIDLGSLSVPSSSGDSIANDINDVGMVTGQSWTNDNSSHAFIWTSGSMRDIGTLGGQNSVGRSINFSGDVAGESEIGSGQTTRAFRFTEADGMVDLGTLGGTNSSAYGINNSGQVVGESDTGPGPVVGDSHTRPNVRPGVRFRGFSFFNTHAFLWTEGVGMTDLGHLGGGTSRATAINNNEVVVGFSTRINGTGYAFSWTRAGGMVDLNTLLPLNSGWVLMEADGINDNGQITGYGLHHGAGRAFRLSPYKPVNV
jgi:probable HAF family extracellular repeat protein